MADNIIATVVGTEFPKPPDNTPATAPVAPNELIGTESKSPSVTGETATVVDAGDLLGNEPAQPAQPASKPAETLAEVDARLGCQCERCQANPEKRDKRGRHHRTCQCKSCKPLPDFSDITAQQAAVDYAAMSAMIFDSSTGILTMTFGPEWQPQNPGERDAVTKALATYLQAKQVKDIPPGMMLSIVILAYSAQRLKAPATSTKLKIGWQWFKVKVIGLFTRRRQPAFHVVRDSNDHQQSNATKQ